MYQIIRLLLLSIVFALFCLTFWNSFLFSISQEVFADPNRDESIIVELLEFEQNVADDQSAVWFLQDLADEQDARQPLVNTSNLSLSIFMEWPNWKQ